MDFISVADFAVQMGISQRAVYKKIKAGSLYAKKMTVNGKEVLMIHGSQVHEPIEPESEPFQEAEFTPVQNTAIADNKTVQKLIDNIQVLIEDRNSSDREYIKKLETELFEAKAMITTLQAENKSLEKSLHSEEILKIQVEAELNILKMRDQEKWFKKL